MSKRIPAIVLLVVCAASLPAAAEVPIHLRGLGRNLRYIHGDASRLWIGKYEELSGRRYLYSLDISNFHNPREGEPHGDLLPTPIRLPTRWDVLHQSDGVLWIGTEEGLMKWKPGDAVEDPERDLRASPDRERIYSLVEDGDDFLLGTRNGVYRWSKNPSEPPRPVCVPGEDCPLPRQPIYALALVGRTLWVGTERILSKWEVGSKTAETVTFTGEGAHALRDTDRALWVGTRKALFRYDKETGEAVRVPLPTGKVYSLSVVASTLWVGSVEGIFAIRGLDEEWEAGIAFTNRLTSTFQPDQQIPLQWKIENFGGRATAEGVEQTVNVYRSDGTPLRPGVRVPAEAHAGGGRYSLNLDHIAEEGDYGVEIQAVDFTGATARSARMPFEVGRPRLTWYSLVIAGLGVVVILFTASVQLRRRALIILGRRWRFVGGGCDFRVEVELRGTEARMVSMHEDRASSQVVEVVVPLGAGWPPASGGLQELSYPRDSLLRFLVNEPAFRWPWAHLLSRWSADDAIIAGQLAVVPPRHQRRLLTHGRRIVFHGLSCAQPSGGGGRLHDAAYEVGVVAGAFRSWGAVVSTKAEADVASVVSALREADVVHVASHATLSGIDLADRQMTVADLTPELLSSLRCRLLVLSACEAGRIVQGNTSFVFQLVREGVNVVAATTPVDSAVCAAFFEEFYRAMLPGRSVGGIIVADAIRRSVRACRGRFGGGASYDWERDVDSFILYGDPSLHLELTDPKVAQTK